MLSVMRHVECVQCGYFDCAIRTDIRGQDVQK